MGKLNLLVPLSAAASRGDQIANAAYAEQQGYSQVLQECDLNPQSLCQALQRLREDRQSYISKLAQFQRLPTIDLLVDEIESLA